MDFGPSKISLEKIPFWDRHRKTPINTSKFQHVVWIVQNTNQHVWNLARRLDSTSRDTTIALGNFIFRCTNHSIVQLPASTFRPITPFGLTTTLRQLYTCRRTITKIRNSRLSNARDLYLVMSLDSWLLTWTPLGTTLRTKPNLNL